MLIPALGNDAVRVAVSHVATVHRERNPPQALLDPIRFSELCLRLQTGGRWTLLGYTKTK